MIDFQAIASASLYDLTSMTEVSTVIGADQATTPNHGESVAMLAARYDAAIAAGADPVVAVTDADAVAVVMLAMLAERIGDVESLRDNPAMRDLVDPNLIPNRAVYDEAVEDGRVDDKSYGDEYAWALGDLADWVDHVTVLNFSGDPAVKG